MKIYVKTCDPSVLDLDSILNKHRDYTVHFFTEYCSPEGVFTYEKNVLYKENVVDDCIETKTVGDFTMTIDNSCHKRTQCFQLPCEHVKQVIFKYVFVLKYVQFIVECVRSGNKCVPVNSYFQTKDVKLIDDQDTTSELNVFLSSLK